jgi:hypothetical protein
MSRIPECPVCLDRRCSHLLQVDGKDYWRCPRCEATFLDPTQLPDLSLERDQYRLHRNEIDDPAYRRFLSRLATPLLERLPANRAGLDYGCGPGPALAAMLTEAGHRMSIYDPMFFDDADALGRRYDFITCTEVVEHFHRPHEQFALLDALLEPAGLLAIMTQFQTDDGAFAGWHYRRDPTHVTFYRAATFARIAHDHRWQCSFPAHNVVLFEKRTD